MADPTALDVKVPGTDWMDEYDTGAFIPPPQVKEADPRRGGKYKYIQFTALAPQADKIKLKDEKGEYLKTTQGYLKAVVEGIKLEESGYEISQSHIGTEQYKKYGKDRQPTGERRNSSPAMDYLRAFGIDARPASPKEYEDLFNATANGKLLLTADWQAYDKDSQSNVAEKWEDFPLVKFTCDGRDFTSEGDAIAQGYKVGDLQAVTEIRRVPFIEKNGKRFWARLSVKRFVSAI